MPRGHKLDQPLIVEDDVVERRDDGTAYTRTVRRETTRREEFLRLLRLGTFVKTAANLVGLGESTVHRWRNQGSKARSGKLKVFAEQVALAISEGELKDTQRIKALAVREGDARTLFRMLQVRHPHWRMPKEHEITVSGSGTGPAPAMVLNVTKLDVEQLKALGGVDLDELGGDLRLPTDDRRSDQQLDTEDPD